LTVSVARYTGYLGCSHLPRAHARGGEAVCRPLHGLKSELFFCYIYFKEYKYIVAIQLKGFFDFFAINISLLSGFSWSFQQFLKQS
jgi:hypothetical protein